MGVSISRTPPEASEPQSGPAGAAASSTAGLAGLALLAAPATSLINRESNNETVAQGATVARVQASTEDRFQHVASVLRGDQQRAIVSRAASPVNQPASPIVKRSAGFPAAGRLVRFARFALGSGGVR